MGNVDGCFAFIVSCGEGLWIPAKRHHAHLGKNMCVCLSFRCKPMLSMLIELLVDSLSKSKFRFGLASLVMAILAPWANHAS